jgi:hypothetical protein
LVAEGTQLGGNNGIMSHTAVKAANSSHMYLCTEYAIKPSQETQQHGDNSTKHNMPMSQKWCGAIDPHRQTMVDLEYIVRELRDKGHEIVVFMDVNQHESRCYRPQTHDQKFKSDTGFNIDGTIAGSLKTFVQNTGLHNIINTKHMPTFQKDYSNA